MNKPKIVHITSSLRCGGAEQVLVTLIAGLRSSFVQTVIYVHDGPCRAMIEQLGVECIPLRGYFGVYDPWSFWRLRALLKKIKPDLIHTLLWAATVIGRAVGYTLRIPIVTVYHGNVDQHGTFRNIVDRATFSWSAVNCAVSEGVATSIRTLLFDSSVTVIHNGIAAEVLVEKKQLIDIGCAHNNIIIGAVGRMVPLKRFDLLIDAVAQLYPSLPQLRLCLIGDGPALPSLRAHATACGVQEAVIFVGAAQALAYYPLFDCFVLPSPREGISIALLEAMRAGIPAIVVTEEKHPVIEDGVHGSVVSPNAASIAGAINALIYDKKRAQELANLGTVLVRNSFNSDVMCMHYAKIFHAVIGK